MLKVFNSHLLSQYLMILCQKNTYSLPGIAIVKHMALLWSRDTGKSNSETPCKIYVKGNSFDLDTSMSNNMIGQTI